MLAAKLGGLTLTVAWTALHTAELLPLLVIVPATFVTTVLTIGAGLIISSTETNRRERKVRVWWIVGTVVLLLGETTLFGMAEYQYATSILLLVLQLWKKYRRQTDTNDDSVFVLFHGIWVTFNSVWVLFADNFFRLVPPNFEHVKIFAAVTSILVSFGLRSTWHSCHPNTS